MEIKTDGERMAVIETKIDNIINGQAITNKKLDDLLPTFVTKSDFNAYKNSQNVQKLLLSVLMILIGTLIGFFVDSITS